MKPGDVLCSSETQKKFGYFWQFQLVDGPFEFSVPPYYILCKAPLSVIGSVRTYVHQTA